jgi:hypothetical protein
MFNFFAELGPDTMTNVSQLGISGLMGALWWWERRYSRQREDELTAAHARIMEQREHLDTLVAALEQNTRAVTEFTAVHQQLVGLLQMHNPPMRAAS